MSRLKKGAAITALAISVIGAHEGLRTKAYLDVVKIPTICFGETRGVKMGDVKTVAQCKEMLGDRLLEFEREMRACLKAPDNLTDGQYVAFLSLSYNIGSRAFCRSTLARKANEGQYVAACNELMKWNKASGVEWSGLTRRRKEERQLCLSGL
jgi:lysozyme